MTTERTVWDVFFDEARVAAEQIEGPVFVPPGLAMMLPEIDEFEVPVNEPIRSLIYAETPFLAKRK